ncbi:MAG: hypothetical protein IT245_03820 [Bacteroidia bacterium]|nr:hypothetical protein [Bacteroidia bacterium]
MKPKSISELLVHFQGYLDMFDGSTQDYKTKARLYLESLNMDIGSMDIPSERIDTELVRCDVTPEYYFMYSPDGNKADLYRENDHRLVDSIQVTASGGTIVVPHKDIIEHFRYRINSGFIKPK